MYDFISQTVVSAGKLSGCLAMQTKHDEGCPDFLDGKTV